ncbi:30S ribosomal protein S1 [Clostridium thermarum]|uniref:30S ribosomal protein S1 n=1 Tax=Clostridium thermarum TaxID=1716543 RepID=UPI001FAE3E32|nr:30S ribosomal protein S1 [Clostridium thermarum]
MKEENVKDFNEQLAYMDQFDKQIVVGEVVKGEVISINEKEAFLNIGYKADAILPAAEVTFESVPNLKDIIKVGDIIEAKVISRRNEDGYVVLSKIELERGSAYNYIKEAFNEKKPVSVSVKEAVKGGLVATYKGIRIFIPASHIELYHVDNLNDYVGKIFDIQIVEFNESKRNTRIIGSRRDLLKAEKDKFEEEVFNKLEKDMIVEGEVQRITSFGAFVDVMGVDGLLHVSELSWGRISKVTDVLKVGDVIKVKILDINKETKKISLSQKALTSDPWSNVEVKYPLDSVVLGKVVRFADFGAFVELEPGVDALVHISEISHKRINKPSEALEIGQQVKAKIIDVDIENKKIGLSIKAVE